MFQVKLQRGTGRCPTVHGNVTLEDEWRSDEAGLVVNKLGLLWASSPGDFRLQKEGKKKGTRGREEPRQLRESWTYWDGWAETFFEIGSASSSICLLLLPLFHICFFLFSLTHCLSFSLSSPFQLNVFSFCASSLSVLLSGTRKMGEGDRWLMEDDGSQRYFNINMG